MRASDIRDIEYLPEVCKETFQILPREIRESAIFSEIVLEIYNGWPGRVGTERVIEKTNLIAKAIPQYAKVAGKSDLEYLTLFAKARRVNYTNWFQEHNLPDLSEAIIFDTLDDFRKRFPSGKSYCPHCEGISTDFYSCNSGKQIKSKVCNWQVNGLFGDLSKGIKVLIKDSMESHPVPTVIFKPIEYDK